MKAFLTLLSAAITFIVCVILLATNPELGSSVSWGGVLAMFLIYLGATSIHIIPVGEMIVSLKLGGNWSATYITASYATTLNESGNLQMLARDPRVKVGWFGNIAFVLWPIWIPVRVPTSAFSLKVHVTRIYTAEKNNSPEVPVRAKVTLVIRLAPVLDKFFNVFQISGRGYNLAKPCPIKDNMFNQVAAQATTSADQKENEQMQLRGNIHMYEGPLIAEIMLRDGEGTLEETVRAVGSRFPYRGKDNLKGLLRTYEMEVRKLLGRWESIFGQAGVLDPEGNPGPATLSVDVNIEDIEVEDPELRKALAKPLIETLNADARAKRGEGERDRINKLKETGLSAQQALSADTLKKVKELKVISAGEEILDVGRKLFGKDPTEKT